MKTAFTLLVVLHGLIHMLGFMKGFELAELKDLAGPVSKTMGLAWSCAFLLFGLVAILYNYKYSYWWLLAMLAVVLSQLIIVYYWQDVKYGTLANIAILLFTIVGYGEWSFEQSYQRDVSKLLEESDRKIETILTAADLAHLPAPVQKYLNYVGVVNQPQPQNVAITFKGKMREKGKNWFSFTAEQHSSLNKPSRLFFMKGKINGLIANGYHRYKDGQSSMLIKLFSLIPVVHERGETMFKAETVTMLNDMCIMIPGSLVNRNIKWETIDDLSAKAIFTNKGVTISAILYFNEEGKLINFVSDDRSEVGEGKQLRFSTPVRAYKNFNGFKLASYGEAIWHFPEGAFVYGRFRIESVKYNVAHNPEMAYLPFFQMYQKSPSYNTYTQAR